MRTQLIGWGKRIVVRAVALLIVLSMGAPLLAGCAGLGYSTPEPVELNFVYIDKIADYQPLAEKFQKEHPNITIKLTTASAREDQGRDLMEKAAEADVMRMPVTNISSEMTKAFMPLDSLLSTNQSFPQDDLFPGTLEGLRSDGKQLGLPAGTNPFVVYYLPTKFAASGVQPPPANWTLEDFVSIAQALNNPDTTQIGTGRYGYGYCTYPTFPDVALFTYLFGGRLFDSLVQVSRPTLNDRGNVETLAWFASLKNDLGLIPDGRSPREVGALVYRSGCGLWVDWLDKSNFGVEGAPEAEPLPLPRHVASMNIASQDGYFILGRTEHPDEAFLWATFLMKEQTASGRLIPPLKTSIDSKEYEARTSKGILAVARSLPEQTVVLSMEMMRSERFGQVLSFFAEAADKVMNGEQEAQFSLDQAQQKAEAIFNQ